MSDPTPDPTVTLAAWRAVTDRPNASGFAVTAYRAMPRLLAFAEAVLALHRPRTVEVITGECANEACDHEDGCPTVPFEMCTECDRIADEVNGYYAENSVRLTAHPCPTAALAEHLGGEGL